MVLGTVIAQLRLALILIAMGFFVVAVLPEEAEMPSMFDMNASACTSAPVLLLSISMTIPLAESPLGVAMVTALFLPFACPILVPYVLLVRVRTLAPVLVLASAKGTLVALFMWTAVEVALNVTLNRMHNLNASIALLVSARQISPLLLSAVIDPNRPRLARVRL